MPALLELQRSFSRALLSEDVHDVGQHIVEDGFSDAERLRIYRNTCHSTLIQVLRVTYPAVDRLVGPEFFDMVAGLFVERHPAGSGYLNEYGGDFAAFLSGRRETDSVPYLPDVARFEWALSVAAHAADAPFLEAQTLAAVEAEQHPDLRFEAHPSAAVLQLDFPADQIADAVLSGEAAAMAQVDLSSGPVRLVVHRGRGGLETQRLDPRQYEFVSRLFAGEPMGRLIALAPDDAAALLAEQLTKGRLTAFERAP